VPKKKEIIIEMFVANKICIAALFSLLSSSSLAWTSGTTKSSTFLSMAGDSSTAVSQAEIIGAGRIGALLAEAGDCKVLGRQDGIDPDGKGPILIATRNDALAGIIDDCPPNRKKDLCFMQNGYLDNLLESKGLLDNTQILLYLSVTALGVPAIDGITTVNPEGLTAATGEHAKTFADRLATLNLKCNVVTPTDYRPAMFEKLMYVQWLLSIPVHVIILLTLFLRLVGFQHTCS
jgi:hypothetical protein